MVKITSVDKNSYAEKAGISCGDILVSVNGNAVNDVLDYRFYITESKLSLLLKREEAEINVVINKPEYNDIGLEFSSYLMDEKKRCRNNCIFCFIDQNPHGMRETVYFKDDDERMSFLMGNYVTLTNLSEKDIERIIKMRISPVNISVHTTDPELRVKMMRNRFAGKCLEYIPMLDKAGISINAQLVICRGYNDSHALEKTLFDLSSLENIESIALVPCGLTGHREGLCEIMPFDKPSANEIINTVEAFGNINLKNRGRRLIYASDEFYLLAGRNIPASSYYEGYPQLENGVGMIRSDSDEFYECLENIESVPYNRNISVATGEAAFGFIKELASRISEKYPSVKITVYAVKNNFFGGKVTVSGLVTGGDIIEQLSGKELGETLIIPENMLRAEGDLFLDGTSLSELSSSLGVPITVSGSGGYSIFEAFTGMKGI